MIVSMLHKKNVSRLGREYIDLRHTEEESQLLQL